MTTGPSGKDIKQHVKIYVRVFAALAVLTVTTVAASYLNTAAALAVFIALSIAIFKGSLVATFFMHLKSEKKLIFVLLAFTVVFFLILLLIPVFS